MENKTCAVCGNSASGQADACSLCGEASWTSAPTEPAPEPTPTEKPARKGKQ